MSYNNIDLKGMEKISQFNEVYKNKPENQENFLNHFKEAISSIENSLPSDKNRSFSGSDSRKLSDFTAIAKRCFKDISLSENSADFADNVIQSYVTKLKASSFNGQKSVVNEMYSIVDHIRSNEIFEDIPLEVGNVDLSKLLKGHQEKFKNAENELKRLDDEALKIAVPITVVSCTGAFALIPGVMLWATPMVALPLIIGGAICLVGGFIALLAFNTSKQMAAEEKKIETSQSVFRSLFVVRDFLKKNPEIYKKYKESEKDFTLYGKTPREIFLEIQNIVNDPKLESYIKTNF